MGRSVAWAEGPAFAVYDEAHRLVAGQCIHRPFNDGEDSGALRQVHVAERVRLCAPR